jgi:DNA-binding Lrp family transcriptional regulator
VVEKRTWRPPAGGIDVIKRRWPYPLGSELLAVPAGRLCVITAIVLVHVESDRIPEVAEAIADLDGVSEVYSVTGAADLIAMVRVREHEALADVIADRLSKVPGVRRTETHIAFRTYSQHDLDAAFSLGVEDAD